MTAHDVLGAAFDLFGRIWPVAGLVLCVVLLAAAALTFLSLVDACRRGPGSGWGEAYREEGGAEDE